LIVEGIKAVIQIGRQNPDNSAEIELRATLERD
jgi:hypothetical protein